MTLKKILAGITKADLTYSLIHDNDKIAVGVSGGKDSMLLLKALKQYQLFPFKNFSFVAVYLDLGFANVDIDTLISFCKELDISLHIEDAKEVSKILNVHANNGHLPCSICSRMKKASINKVAHQLNCNKVAFAHHVDDAIETLLMNTIYGGRIATFTPQMYLDNTQLTFIRPFILIREKDIISACKKEKIPVIKSPCPNDKKTMREEAKEMLNYIYNKYPESYQNYRNLLSDYDHFSLYFDKEIYPLDFNHYIKPCINKEQVINYITFKKSKNIYHEKDNLYLIYHENQLIGKIRYFKENEKFIIDDLYLNKENKNDELIKKILLFIEGEISSKNSPCQIEIRFILKQKILNELNYQNKTKTLLNAYRYHLKAK